MSAWPATLPQTPLTDGYSDTLANNVIATGMDVGPQKRRMRGTVAPRRITFQMRLTSAQVEALQTFFVTTTHYGTDSFTFPLPPTGVSTSVHFTPGSPPTMSPVGIEGVYAISIEVDP